MAGEGYVRAIAKIQLDYLCMHCGIDFRSYSWRIVRRTILQESIQQLGLVI